METQISKPNIFMPMNDGLARAKTLEFSDLQFPTRNSKQSANQSYRVYRSKDKSDFIEVEGNAAYEVLAKCGIERPYRVIRTKMEVSTILNVDELEVPADSVPQLKVNDPGSIIPLEEAVATEAAPVAAEAAPAEETPKAE